MVEMARKAYAEGWMVEMDFHDGSSLLRDLAGEDGICICELPKRGQKQDIMPVPIVCGVDSQNNSKSSRLVADDGISLKDGISFYVYVMMFAQR